MSKLLGMLNLLLISSIFLLFIIMNPKVAFADTGVMVNDYTSVVEDKEYSFIAGNEVFILLETDWGFTVYRNGIRHQIPRSSLLRLTKTTQQYVINKEIPLLVGNVQLRKSVVGETFQLLKYTDESRSGLFQTKDGLEIIMNLDDLNVIIEKSKTFGLLKADLSIDTDTVILGGSILDVLDFKDGSFIVSLEDGSIHSVTTSSIDISKPLTRSSVSRSSLTSRSVLSKQNQLIESLVAQAHKEIGKKYVYGSANGLTYDCSGLTYSLYKSVAGMTIPRDSLSQSKFGIKVERKDLRQGDLVFFKTTKAPVGHVGIYIGNGKMIHASSGQGKVMISGMDEAYFKSRYVISRRILNN